MNKREKHFLKIEELKERFRELSTEKIVYRIHHAPIKKEGAIAYREVLAECGVDMNKASDE
jgi:hypothetical protein